MHAQKIGQKLLREIIGKMSRDVVHMHAYNIQNMSREMKYLYGLSLFNEPMSAYVWGMLSFEEADELCYAYRTVLNEKTYNMLNEMKATDLTPEQESLRQTTMNKIAQDKPINRENVLTKLGFSEEKIGECYLSFAETINHLLLKVDFDMYIDMARCFLPSYFPAMARFDKSKLLLLENYFSQKIEEWHQAEVFVKDNVHPTDKMLYQLDVINHIIIQLKNQSIAHSRLEKINAQWQNLAKTCFYLTAQKMGELPANKYNRKIKPRMNEVSQAFMKFFPKPLPENKRQPALDKLIQDTYMCIDKCVLNKEQKEVIMQSFETAIGVPYQKKKAEKEVKKSPYARMKEAEIKLETAWIKTEFEELKKKYLTEAELQDKDACRSVYAFMTDAELLYMMGVFKKSEYEACCRYQDKVIEHNGLSATESRSISEIFEILLDLPGDESIILPLKKEYLQQANQIRQASKLYQALYTDNFRPALSDILPEKFEHNYLEQEDNLFLQEGIFLENMIYIAHHTMRLDVFNYIEHHTMQLDVFNSKIPELVDNYWLEAVQGLETLPHYPKHLYMKETFKFCSKILQEPSQAEVLIPDLKDCTVEGRKLLYEIVINQIHYSLCELYQNNIPERGKMLQCYYHYVKPFQNMLNEPKLIDKQSRQKSVIRPERER